MNPNQLQYIMRETFHDGYDPFSPRVEEPPETSLARIRELMVYKQESNPLFVFRQNSWDDYPFCFRPGDRAYFVALENMVEVELSSSPDFLFSQSKVRGAATLRNRSDGDFLSSKAFQRSKERFFLNRRIFFMHPEVLCNLETYLGANPNRDLWYERFPGLPEGVGLEAMFGSTPRDMDLREVLRPLLGDNIPREVIRSLEKLPGS